MFHCVVTTNLFLDCRKEAWVSLLINDIIGLALMLFITYIWVRITFAVCIVSRTYDPCSVLLVRFVDLSRTGKLSSPKETIAYHLPKHLLFGCLSSIVELLPGYN